MVDLYDLLRFKHNFSERRLVVSFAKHQRPTKDSFDIESNNNKNACLTKMIVLSAESLSSGKKKEKLGVRNYNDQ